MTKEFAKQVFCLEDPNEFTKVIDDIFIKAINDNDAKEVYRIFTDAMDTLRMEIKELYALKEILRSVCKDK